MGSVVPKMIAQTAAARRRPRLPLFLSRTRPKPRAGEGHRFNENSTGLQVFSCCFVTLEDRKETRIVAVLLSAVAEDAKGERDAIKEA